jgi:hypothetical protein
VKIKEFINKISKKRIVEIIFWLILISTFLYFFISGQLGYQPTPI